VWTLDRTFDGSTLIYRVITRRHRFGEPNTKLMMRAAFGDLLLVQREGPLVDVCEQATHDQRHTQQTDRQSDWQHDHGDAESEADHHHDQSDHDRRRVLEEATESRARTVK
jgi:hypothetical protein